MNYNSKDDEEAEDGVHVNASKIVEHEVQVASFYNENDEELIQSILNEIGFGITAYLFKGEFIDYEAFINMNSVHILAIFKDFPVGYAIKFEIALNEWKLNQHHIPLSAVDETSKIMISQGVIKRLLEKSTEGVEFLNNLDTSQQMSESDKSTFIKLVLMQFFKKQQLLSSREIIDLAKEIQNEFPNEQASSYVDLNTGIGVLYHKYNNTLKTLRANRQMPESSLTIKRNSNKRIKKSCE